MTVDVRPLTGDDLLAHLDGLARLRIEVFRAFPYLYDGTMDYERRYLETYARAPGSAIIGAFDGGELVGAATGVPLAHEPDYATAPFREAGLDVHEYFYFGESVLRASYRGQGIGVKFFEAREAHARALDLGVATFCAVERPVDHPRRPHGYEPLDAFWRRRGFAPMGLRGAFSWRDLDEDDEREKPMVYWSKALR